MSRGNPRQSLSGRELRGCLGESAVPIEFVVTWSSDNQDGSGYGVYAQRYAFRANTPPTAEDDQATTDEDTTVLIDVLANHTDGENNIVPTLTSNLTSPSRGTLTNHGDGTFTFDPAGDFETLAIGESAEVSFDYKIEDAFGQTDTATVRITITGVNDTPIADGGTAAATEDGPKVAGQLVADDVDSDDDSTTLSYALVSGPSEGSVTVNPDGSFSFDPGSDFQDLAQGETRDVSFTFEATDSHGAISNQAVVMVTVTGVNDAPVADDGTAAATENGSPVAGQLVADDIDSDDDSTTLSYALVSGPSEGSVTVNPDGSFSFDPGSDFPDLAQGETRDVSFTFEATDRHNAVSNVAAVVVTITGVNDAPTGIQLSGNVVIENAEGALIGSLSTADLDASDTHLYSVDDARFEVVNGSLGGTILANDVMQLTLQRTDAFDYAFAEIGQQVGSGDTAGIGFWQNKHGQALIAEGGSELAAWLTENFSNVFGNSLANATGEDVADFYRDQLFRQKAKKSAGPAKVDAQFMGVALATYFTSNQLAGNVAASYGFNVTDTGIGTNLVDVGSNGAAFGLSDSDPTELTIMQLLQATNSLTDTTDSITGFATLYDRNGDGTIDSEEAALREIANSVYAGINDAGNI